MNSLFADARALAIDELHAQTAIYTAQPTVDELLDRCDWPNGADRLVDPSCGDGMFLERALCRLLAAMPGIDARAIGDRLEGWEIHPHAAHQARSRVSATLRANGYPAPVASECARQLVTNADFLTDAPACKPRYQVIAGNPPYLRYVHVPELLRRDYEAAVPDHARADLLHSFLDRCASLLLPGGQIAFVTADRWLFNENAAGLRKALGGRALGVDHLARLDAATVFYRPKDRRAGTPPRIHPVAVVLSAAGGAAMTSAPIYPEAANDDAGVSRRLRDIARVELAPLVDKCGVWLIDQVTARRLPPEFLVPAVDTDDIVDGVLRAPTRFALCTDDDEPPRVILEHIAAGWHKLPPRHQRKTRSWLPPETWHKRISLSRSSMLVPRIAKTLKPIRIPPGVLPINHNLSLVSSTGGDGRDIEAALMAPAAQAWIEARAPRLENGYLSITTKLLRELPVFAD